MTAVDEDGVTLKTPTGSTHIPSHTVIWAAGVAVTDFGRLLAKRTGAETDKAGHIKVAPDLTIPNYPEIFVVGDLAGLCGPRWKAAAGRGAGGDAGGSLCR